MKVGVAAATVLSLVLMAESAENDDSFERFKLWNECRPMRLVVALPNVQKATAIGLTARSLEVAIRSRLRGSRLYTEDASEALWTRLWISVNVNPDDDKHTFATAVEYEKAVTDIHGQSEYAVVWQTGKYGAHNGKEASIIRNGIAEMTDEFLDAYLRVNEAACKEPPPKSN